MKIVRVIPIAKGAPREELSYFSKHEILPGSIVSIPVRKKEYPALVIGSQDATFDKALIRSSDFALKKISTILRDNFFSSAFLDTCTEVADYYISNVGAVLNLFTSGTVLKN